MSQPKEMTVRRHVHDMRNHLNGLEMDAMFLADLFPDKDSDAHGISLRVSKELARIESTLRGLSACFAGLEVAQISAVDLFHRWKSRSSKFVTDPPVEWECRADSGTVEVDGRIVADLLSCLVGTAASISSSPVRALVLENSGEILFEIQTEGRDCIQEVPDYVEVFEKNGGQVERLSREDGVVIFRIRFPSVSEG